MPRGVGISGSAPALLLSANYLNWLCSPKGAGFLYVRRDAQPLLEPLTISWDWSEDAWADRHRWTGTSDPSPQLTVPAAIDFQAAHDWHAVRRRCHELAVLAERKLTELGMEPLATNDAEYVQMVAVRLPPCDPEELSLRLYREHRIEVLAQDWRGQPTLRVSFQGYNDESDLDALLSALPRLV